MQCHARVLAGALVAWVLAGSDAHALRVLCSTFPIYQIVRNVTQGRAGVTVARLLPAALGCPHHYALTPQDMRKLDQAEVLVVNGLGLEEFLDASLKQANPRLTVLDSSAGVPDLLPLACADHACGQPPGTGGHALRHDHAPNPHLFASPRQTARLARNIAEGLARLDPDGAGVYARNAQAYAARLDALADAMAAQVRTLRNNRIVQPHGVFDYLARDIGLVVVAVTQPHGLEPSAAELLALVTTIRERQAGLIVTEPQYSPKVGQTLARETGVPTAQLDPVASGPDDAPLDHYEAAMRRNLETLLAAIGTSP